MFTLTKPSSNKRLGTWQTSPAPGGTTEQSKDWTRKGASGNRPMPGGGRGTTDAGLSRFTSERLTALVASPPQHSFPFKHNG